MYSKIVMSIHSKYKVLWQLLYSNDLNVKKDIVLDPMISQSVRKLYP